MSISLEARFCGSGWSEEYDSLPLRSRQKMLHKRVTNQDHMAVAAGNRDAEHKSHSEICVDRKEDGNLYEERMHTTNKSRAAVLAISEFPNHHASDSGPQIKSLDNGFGDVGYPGGSDLEWTSRISRIHAGKGPNFQARGEDLVEADVNNAVGMVICQTSSDVAYGVPQDCSVNSTGALVEAAKEDEILYGFDDDLDNLVLGKRRRILLSRKLMQSSSLCMSVNNEKSPNSSKTMTQCADIEKQECDAIQDTPFTKIMTNQVLPLPTKVKDEPVDVSELCSDGNNGLESSSGTEMVVVKTEPAYSDSFGDELDHLPLADRVKLLSSGKTGIEMPDNFESLKDDVDGGTDIFNSFQPVSISRPLKRKRTATNSVETALEEDAPGLLKVLIERGILVEEIKLYGEEESDGNLDDSFSEDSFGELEAVISQLFQRGQPFLKFPLLRTKSGKISYCLACLLSLVEQIRYLQNQKWPVEWGWCRDLQSFIFVFHRHNRIVLERPEYGYATYFFELLASVPVAWQIKRLVTAMKLTSCGRITLIENKPLVVGEDLSEGEARVLAEFGWTPNAGLGTMLNYCDRVVHDRKQERDSLEWRSKIGRQLMNGYNCGNIVSKSLPKKLIEYQDSAEVQVKLEQ